MSLPRGSLLPQRSFLDTPSHLLCIAVCHCLCPAPQLRIWLGVLGAPLFTSGRTPHVSLGGVNGGLFCSFLCNKILETALLPTQVKPAVLSLWHRLSLGGGGCLLSSPPPLTPPPLLHRCLQTPTAGV